MPTIVETLAAYVAADRLGVLPDLVVHHAKRALIDWFAALLPGTGLPPATLLMAGLEDELGHGGAIIYGSRQRGPIRTAALINATAAQRFVF